MNVQHLKAVFLHDFENSRLKFTARVVSRHWEIIAIPAIPVPHQARVWLAKVQLSTELTDSRFLGSGWQFYRYQPDHFSWTLMDTSDTFDAALEGLSPELRLFCLLKTMASLAVQLTFLLVLYHVKQDRAGPTCLCS